LIIFASMALFGLPMRGDWFTLFIVVGVFLVGGLGTGLLVSTVADAADRLQASMLLAFLPVFMLSDSSFRSPACRWSCNASRPWCPPSIF
jgi:ABC-2 type transport system permease protein